MNMSRTDVNKWLNENKYHEENMNSLNSSNTVINTPSVTQVIDNTPSIKSISNTPITGNVEENPILRAIENLNTKITQLSSEVTTVKGRMDTIASAGKKLGALKANKPEVDSFDMGLALQNLYNYALTTHEKTQLDENGEIISERTWSSKGLYGSFVSYYAKVLKQDMPSNFPKDISALGKKVSESEARLNELGLALKRGWIDGPVRTWTICPL